MKQTSVKPKCRRLHTRRTPRLRPVAALVIAMTAAANSAQAQIVADPTAPGRQRPTVLAAPNGVPLVNIQTPSAAGVSRNLYGQFDVDRRGAILNNSRTDTPTQLGGWVQGNPWLARGPARVILNEVRSSDPSRLGGYIEVGGERAQVVVANPAGISCDGCGFINASRALVTTGIPRLEDEALAGLRVEGGTVEIRGDGLDGRSLDYTGIIARAVRLDARALADTLVVVAGTHEVRLDADGRVTQVAPIAAGGSKPPVAIDVSSLGGMYAGRILMVGNGAGVGVRNAGAIGAAAGDVVVTTDGRLENLGLVDAVGRLRADAEIGIANAGVLTAGTGLELSTRGDVDHQGVIAAWGDLRIAATGPASELRAGAGSVIAAGLQADGSIGAQGIASVFSTQSVQSAGRHLGGAGVAIASQRLDLSGSETLAPAVVLQADAGDLVLSGARVASAGTVDLATSQVLRTDGASVSAGHLALKAGSLSNRAGEITQTGPGELALRLPGDVDNEGGQIAALGPRLLLQAASVSNRRGKIAALADLAISASRLSNEEGSVSAQGAVSIDLTSDLDNRAGLVAGQGPVRVNAAAIDNRGGRIASTGDALAVSAAGSIANGDGLLLAAASADLRASRLENASGTMASQGAMSVQAREVVNASGTLASASSVRLEADALDNLSGLVHAGGVVDVAAGRIANTGGTLSAGSLLRIAANRLGGDGSLLSAGDIEVSLQEDYHHTGQFQADGSARLETAGTVANESVLAAGAALRVKAGGLDNRETGRLASGHLQIELAGPGTLLNRGLIDGVSVDVEATTVRNVGTGRLYGDRLAILARDLVNEAESGVAPVIAARERLDLGVRTLVNSEHALIFSAGDLALGGTLDANREATGAAERVTNTSATLEALGRIRLSAARVDNVDAHFSTVEVPLPDEAITEYAGQGSPVRYRAGTPGVEVFNAESDHLRTPEGVYERWTRYDYTRASRETRIATSDPGRIVSGSDMRIDTEILVNDKGRIMAGGALEGVVGRLENIEVSGQRIATDQGTATSFWRVKQHGWDRTGSDTQPYNPPDTVETIILQPSLLREHAREPEPGAVVSPPAAPSLTLPPAALPAPKIPVGDRPAPAPPEVPGVQVGRVDPLIPSNRLWQLATAPERPYLVETDPRFADHRQWLGSDYLLSALQVDPTVTQKRLGDGFYEQRLVREQVASLTGRRYLEGYPSDESQFQALMDAGIRFAREHQLRPGIALSAEQMAQLTTDMVWLVEQTVQMPDGTTARALVPQVYVRVREGDVEATGGLLSARDLRLQVTGDARNSGVLLGGSRVALEADNLDNRGGRIVGREVTVHALQDLTNIGGSIRGQTLLDATAGRDIHLTTTTAATTNATGSRVSIDRIAGLYITEAEGLLHAEAGRDLNLTAATIDSRGTLDIRAQRDLNLNTLTESSSERIVWDDANHRSEQSSREAGSRIRSRSDASLQAANDLNARAASVTSEQGALLVSAGRDIHIVAGESRVSVDEAHRHTHRGLLSRTTVVTRDQVDAASAQGSTFSGDSVAVEAGRDIRVAGSQVVSTDGTHLSAGRDVRVYAVTESTREEHLQSEKKSGVFSAGVGVTIGRRSESTELDASVLRSAGSTIGSTDGDVVIQAGGSYRQVGSAVIAPCGDIAIDAKKVELVEAREGSASQAKTMVSQSGLTASLSNSVVSAVQTGGRMRRAAAESTDPRMRQLAAVTAATAAVEAASMASKDPVHAGGGSVSVGIGSSRSASNSTQSTDAAAGSKVLAGGNVRIRASGAGEDSDITVQGSSVQAGGVATLQAEDDVNLLAARNRSSQHASNHSSGTSVGVSIGLSGKQPPVAITASLSRGQGHADGEDLTWTAAQVSGGAGVVVDAHDDVVLRGATIRGPQVTGRIGGDLVVESLQDVGAYESRQRSASAGVSVGLDGSFRGQAGVSRSDADRRHATVVEQAGVFAGDGGFDIDVKGHTDLRAGALASSERAVAEGRNRFATATLTTTDLENHASASASSSGYQVSSDMLTRGKYGVAKGVVANTMVNAGESGSSSGATRAVVSGGQVLVTDDEGQRALTGVGAVESVVQLNRDTAGAHVAATRPDLEGMQRNVEANRAIKEETVRVGSRLSDEAYRSRFETQHDLVKVDCPKEGGCVNSPESLVRRPFTREEFAQAEGRPTIAVNGILNDQERAAQLSYQNMLPDAQSGKKTDEVYLLHVAPANNLLSELIGVGYERLTVAAGGDVGNVLGFTNAQIALADLLHSRGQQPTNSDGHSRGTLVQAGAFYLLANRDPQSGGPFVNPSLNVRGVGGAMGAVEYTNLARRVIGPSEGVKDIQFNYFSNDPVSVFSLAGGNPGSWGLGDLLQVLTSDRSVHSCYGTGATGCRQVEVSIPGGPRGNARGNHRLIEYLGGTQINREQATRGSGVSK